MVLVPRWHGKAAIYKAMEDRKAMHPMAEKENAEQFEKDEADRRGDLVFEALGTASMCWDSVPSGVFDSVQAEKIGQWLLASLAKKTDLTLADWLTQSPKFSKCSNMLCGHDPIPTGSHCLKCGKPADG